MSIITDLGDCISYRSVIPLAFAGLSKDMLAKADTQQLKTLTTRDVSQQSLQILNQRVWLPALLYDGLPYFYLTAGFAAIFATLYISEWFWILPYYLLFAAACLHLAYVVHRNRSETPAYAEAATAAESTSATGIYHQRTT